MKAPSRRAWLIGAGVLAAIVVGLPLLVLALVGAGAGNGLIKAALEARLHRPVAFRSLRTRLGPGEARLAFSDLVIGEPKAFGVRTLAEVPRLELTVRLAPLLTGRLVAPEIAATSPVLHLRRKGPGNDNWTFGKSGASSFLEGTRRLSVTQGRFEMDDPQRHLAVKGSVENAPDDPRTPLRLKGEGVLNGAPFTFTAHGGPLNGRRPGTPHPFDAELVDGATHVDIVGAAQRPFDFRGFDVDLKARGPNAADLVYLFSLLAPNSPPFTLSAHMSKRAHDLKATGFHVVMGRTDLMGEIASSHDGPRRRITAHLTSARLTREDFKVMLAKPPPHMQTRSQPGTAEAGGHTPPGKVLSRAPFSFARFGDNDIRLDYAARRVEGYAAPLSDVRLVLDLTQGRMRLSPATMAVAGGRARVDLVIDAVARPARVSLQTRARGLRLASLSRGKGGFTGLLDADLDVKGAGASMAEAAAHADGAASFRLGSGALPAKDAAALSGDLFGLIGGALGGGKAPLRCAVGDFRIRDGVMQAQRLDVGAGKGLAAGGGRIDLRDETLALALRPTSEGPKPAVQLKTPITVTGPFSHPKVGAKLSKASLSLGGLFSGLFHPSEAKAPPPAC